MRKYTTRLVLFLVLLSITCSCILAAVSLQCSASGDPHFNTFQSFAYEMFNVQESVIVKSNKFSAMLRTLKTSGCTTAQDCSVFSFPSHSTSLSAYYLGQTIEQDGKTYYINRLPATLIATSNWQSVANFLPGFQYKVSGNTLLIRILERKVGNGYQPIYPTGMKSAERGNSLLVQSGFLSGLLAIPASAKYCPSLVNSQTTPPLVDVGGDIEQVALLTLVMSSYSWSIQIDPLWLGPDATGLCGNILGSSAEIVDGQEVFPYTKSGRYFNLPAVLHFRISPTQSYMYPGGRTTKYLNFQNLENQWLIENNAESRLAVTSPTAEQLTLIDKYCVQLLQLKAGTIDYTNCVFDVTHGLLPDVISSFVMNHQVNLQLDITQLGNQEKNAIAQIQKLMRSLSEELRAKSQVVPVDQADQLDRSADKIDYLIDRLNTGWVMKQVSGQAAAEEIVGADFEDLNAIVELLNDLYSKIKAQNNGQTSTTLELLAYILRELGAPQPGSGYEDTSKTDVDCAAILKRKPAATDGVYIIYPKPDQSIKVRCDMKNGGLIVFARRLDGTVDFYQSWNDYVNGFGDPTGEYFLGLEDLHTLTQDGQYGLIVDMKRQGSSSLMTARYKSFAIGGADTKYKLFVQGYYGNAGDSLSYHNNRPFTTKDSDNDEAEGNCAVHYKGAFWYGACHTSNLFGAYLAGPHQSYADGIEWLSYTGYYNSLVYLEMKFAKISDIPQVAIPNNDEIVIQRRANGAVAFETKMWNDYVKGFGDLSGDYWAGLDTINQLTTTRSCRLIVEMKKQGDTAIASASYSTFQVGKPNTNYKLKIGGFLGGTAGDSMLAHNGMQFSTPDKDHDTCACNCAQVYKGSWWYAACHAANPNGKYLNGPHTSYADGVEYNSYSGYYNSLVWFEMRLKCASPKSCKDIKNTNAAATSGQYTIYVKNQPVNVYCDMSSADGGGYTRLYYKQGANTCVKNDGIVWDSDALTNLDFTTFAVSDNLETVQSANSWLLDGVSIDNLVKFANNANCKTPIGTAWSLDYNGGFPASTPYASDKNTGYTFFSGKLRTFGTWNTFYAGCNYNSVKTVGTNINLRVGGAPSHTGEFIHSECNGYDTKDNSITSRWDWANTRAIWVR